MAVHGFWMFLNYVQHLSPGHSCTAVTQSTHGTSATQNAIVYGGNCAQAFLVALQSHGSIAWILGS